MGEAAAKPGVPIHPLRLISELQKILTPRRDRVLGHGKLQPLFVSLSLQLSPTPVSNHQRPAGHSA